MFSYYFTTFPTIQVQPPHKKASSDSAAQNDDFNRHQHNPKARDPTSNNKVPVGTQPGPTKTTEQVNTAHHLSRYNMIKRNPT